MFCVKKMNMLSVYLKYVVIIDNLYSKGPNSKNSKNRQAKTPVSRFPIAGPILC